MNKVFILITGLFFKGLVSAQQDRHYSMWSESQSLINAGSIGMMAEDIRLLVNYRTQWLTGSGQPFTSGTFLIDTKFKTRNSFNTFGLGLNITNDLTGDARVTTNTIALPLAYSIALDRKNYLSIGLTPGYQIQSLGNGSQTWDNQWNGEGFDQSVFSGEYYQNQVTSFDIGTGIYYKCIVNENTNFSSGISVNHLNNSMASFFNTNAPTPRNLTFMLSGTRFMNRRKFGISPQLIATFMGPNRFVVLGSLFEHELFESSERTDYVKRSVFAYGILLRWNDAVITTLAYKFKNFKLGASYDFNFSPLKSVTKGVGAIEVFLKYSIALNRSSYIHDRKFFRFGGSR
jgi:type IX secretion system PorP/SprF family membrane protein